MKISIKFFDAPIVAAKKHQVTILNKLQMPLDPQEKKHLEHIMKRIELLRPMSACGFFEIGKSTLTGMLSVR